MSFVVVLVEPEFEFNIGMSARVMKNFEFNELRLVRPKAKIGERAKMFAKHAKEILENAEKFESLNEATKDCELVVAMTSQISRFRKKLKNCISLRELSKKIGKEKVALVFGGEGNGLNEKDIRGADLVVTIPANSQYPVLNLSHAVGVVCYSLYKKKFSLYKPAPKWKRELIEKKLKKIVRKLDAVRNKSKVPRAFTHMMERSRIADDEANAILAALSPIEELTESQIQEHTHDAHNLASN